MGAGIAPDGPVLVTGASGQVGEGVVDRLRAAGRPVIALRHRSDVAARWPGIDWVAADLKNGTVDLGGRRPVAVVHAAGLWMLPPHLPGLIEAGVRRVVCFGSTSLFGKLGSVDSAERRMVERLATAEAAVAEICDAAAIAWTVLRPNLIYGRGTDRNVTSAARFILRTGVYPIAAPASGLRQPVHADDLGAAAIAALEAPATAGRAYNLGGGETLTYREMIGRIFDALGKPRRLLPVPGLASLVGAAGVLLRKPSLNADVIRRMNRDLAFDDGAAGRDFGYAPRPFLSGGRADLGL